MLHFIFTLKIDDAYYHTDMKQADGGMAQYQRIKLYIKKRNLFISSKEFKIPFFLYANLSMRNFLWKDLRKNVSIFAPQYAR